MSIQDIFQSIVEVKGGEVAGLVRAEIEAGTDVSVILNKGLIGAMDEVGQQFSEGKLYVPEMLQAAQTMKAGLEVLRPKLVGAATKPRGTVVLGSVKGDLHDIGKNLVAMMLEGAGFRIVDLGVDVPPKRFLDAAKENRAHLVAMSALLTTTMPSMYETVALLKEAGVGARAIVGGAPVNRSYAEEIRADGYSSDAVGAVELAKNLVPPPE
jgi:5-methyltetrahydrofolate--homocysteine methyltransferase